MNDLKQILESALTDAPALDLAVDPTADLMRGRNRLHRRRTALLSGVTAVVLAAGLTPMALSSLGRSGSAPTSTAGSPMAGPASVALISYTGQQPEGYTVDWIPQGWEIQGVDPFSLTIAPAGAKNQDPSSWTDKLVVLSASEFESMGDSGTSQPVAGRPGRVKVADDVLVLKYVAATGRLIVIQAPLSLGWDSSRIAEFAAGVTVLKAAQSGRG